MGSSVTVRDTGWQALKAQLLGHQALGVKVGIIADESHGDGEVTVAQVAAWNEFGTQRNGVTHVPARPAFRNTFDTYKGQIKAAMAEVAKEIAAGADPEKGLKRLGLFVQSLVRRSITDLRVPPNARRTIKAKGSSNPLIDTGQMRRAVSFELLRGAAAVTAKEEAQRELGGGTG